MVRHTTLAITKGVCYGQSDVLPSDTFIEEANNILKTLKKVEPNNIYTSPSTRCRKLAEQLGYHNTIIDKRLMEMDFGDWEMKHWDNIHGAYAERWMNDYINTPTPNGESMLDLVRRVEDFINDVCSINQETVLAFTHGGPIRMAMHLIESISLEKVFDYSINYGSVNYFRI